MSPANVVPPAHGAAGEGVDAAMARVLQAEAQARRDIEATTVQAQQRLEQARAQAREIEEQGRLRVTGLRQRMQARTRMSLQALQAQADALPDHPEPTPAQWQALSETVEQLAAALTEPPP